jgi:hypothetical protein
VTLTTVVGGQTVVVGSVTTDATGKFSFGNLAAGTYTLTETPPAGYTDEASFAGPVAVSNNIQGPGGTIANIAVSAGTNLTDYDFLESSLPSF